MKNFTFTVDDNIRVLKEITQDRPESIFDHPYLAMYRRLHEQYGLKVQLNLFYEMEEFDLSQMPDTYRAQWQENAHWLKLSFHSRLENVRPYEFSGYEEVYRDCEAVHTQILRFASPENLGRTTTVHYCVTTREGAQALEDLGMTGLLGLFYADPPRSSYSFSQAEAQPLIEGALVRRGGVTYAGIDVVMNSFDTETVLEKLRQLNGRGSIRVMIHEQYFYPDYRSYQPEFEEKIGAAFSYLRQQGYESRFFEEIVGES